jgi:hypothetical protein
MGSQLRMKNTCTEGSLDGDVQARGTPGDRGWVGFNIEHPFCMPPQSSHGDACRYSAAGWSVASTRTHSGELHKRALDPGKELNLAP